MAIKLDGTVLDCSPRSLWDRRMLDGKRVKNIASYFPEIGRGSIEHDVVPHDVIERGIVGCAKKTMLESICGWLDI